MAQNSQVERVYSLHPEQELYERRRKGLRRARSNTLTILGGIAAGAALLFTLRRRKADLHLNW